MTSAARAGSTSGSRCPIVARELTLERPSSAMPKAVMRTALTGRTHGRTDQQCDVKISLANPEPSTHGTLQRSADSRFFVRYRGITEVRLVCRPDSKLNPKPTSSTGGDRRKINHCSGLRDGSDHSVPTPGNLAHKFRMKSIIAALTSDTRSC
jgi:hypothetical protein